tara:strand:- start:134 stop:301 length:168 start_codon:yes stop_codon:yes gene_type:complete
MPYARKDLSAVVFQLLARTTSIPLLPTSHVPFNIVFTDRNTRWDSLYNYSSALAM